MRRCVGWPMSHHSRPVSLRSAPRGENIPARTRCNAIVPKTPCDGHEGHGVENSLSASAPARGSPQQGAPALPPGAVRFSCQDGSSFIATFGDVSVTLQTALGNLTLDQTVSADGARYRNSAFQVWFKGRQATVTNFLQNTNTVCQQQ